MKGIMNQKRLFYLSGILTFITSFIIYLFTLAPSVTLEDSGELIAAAYNLGVPHQPGYPLFTLLGKLFSLLPIGSIAFRLNMMSALFSSLGAVFICLSVILLLENASQRSWKKMKGPSQQHPLLLYATGVSAGLFTAFSFELWEQSLITEVYGLHAFFTGLFIYLYLLYKKQTGEKEKRRYTNLLFLATGLSLTNHSTAVFFLPILLVDLLLFDFRFLFRLKTLWQGMVSFLLGLLPLAYLPIASSRNPVIDWGNPENMTNFLRTIGRHQYTGMEQNMDKFLSELQFYLTDLLIQQWFPLFLLLLIPAFIFLYKKSRNFGLFSLIFLIFTIFVTTYVADFDIRGNDINARLNRVLVTVFYIPSYMMTGMLMAIGLYYLASFLKSKTTLQVATAVILLLPAANVFRHYEKVDMHDFRLADRFCENLFGHLPDNALLFAHVDYLYFPTLYYQYVLDQRKDLVILDQELLRRSWYIDMLRTNHPELIKSASPQVERFLTSLQPFEDGEPYDGSVIQRNYIAMINAFIDNTLEKEREVYYTLLPSPEIRRGYNVESLVYAFRLFPGDMPKPVSIDELKLGEFKQVSDDDIFFSRFVRDYYMELLLIRAQAMETMGAYREAILCYEEILAFDSGDNRLKEFARARSNSISQ
jgi:hypothetical protein